MLETKQWTKIKANHDWESTEFTHQCGTWSRSRKFVAVRRENEIDAKDADTLFEMKEYDYFCYVLTDELAPWQAHKQYGQRATSETWIEEAKNQSAHWLILKPLIFGPTVPYSKRPYLLTILCAGWHFAAGIKYCNAGRRRLYEPFSSEWQENGRPDSRQQKLRVPKRMLYNAQWEAWVAVAET